MILIENTRCPRIGSPGGTRTCNLPINSRTLCQLSYGGSAPARLGAAVPGYLIVSAASAG
jgi:hypothetical protein